MQTRPFCLRSNSGMLALEGLAFLTENIFLSNDYLAKKHNLKIFSKTKIHQHPTMADNHYDYNCDDDHHRHHYNHYDNDTIRQLIIIIMMIVIVIIKGG